MGGRDGARIEDEQVAEIFLGEMDGFPAGMKLFRVDHGAAETLFRDLPLEDFFLDGAGGEETINANDGLLTIAPDASHGLQVVGRIPVDVVQDQRRCTCGKNDPCFGMNSPLNLQKRSRNIN